MSRDVSHSAVAAPQLVALPSQVDVKLRVTCLHAYKWVVSRNKSHNAVAAAAMAARFSYQAANLLFACIQMSRDVLLNAVAAPQLAATRSPRDFARHGTIRGPLAWWNFSKVVSLVLLYSKSSGEQTFQNVYLCLTRWVFLKGTLIHSPKCSRTHSLTQLTVAVSHSLTPLTLQYVAVCCSVLQCVAVCYNGTICG